MGAEQKGIYIWNPADSDPVQQNPTANFQIFEKTGMFIVVYPCRVYSSLLYHHDLIADIEIGCKEQGAGVTEAFHDLTRDGDTGKTLGEVLETVEEKYEEIVMGGYKMVHHIVWLGHNYNSALCSNLKVEKYTQ